MPSDLPTPVNYGAITQPNAGVPTLGGSPLPSTFDSLSEETEAGFDWRRYLSAVMRYKFLVIALTVIGTGLGAVASRFLSPQYRAEAKIWIAASSPGSIAGPIAQGELVDTYAWIPLLRSREVLRNVVLERRLYLSVARNEHRDKLATLTLGDSIRPGSYKLTVDKAGTNFTLRVVDGDIVDTGVLGEPIGEAVGLTWQPDASLFSPGDEVEFYVSTPSQAAIALGNRLQANIVDRSGNFLDVALEGTSPEEVTHTLNAVVDRFVDQAASLKKEQLVILTNVLQGQRATAERNLRIAEDALRRHQVETIGLPSAPGTAGPTADLGSSLMTDYVQLNVDRRNAQRDRQAIETALASVANGALPVDAIEVIPTVQNSTELTQLLDRLNTQKAQRRALLNRYTQDHPSVEVLTQEIETLENGTIPAGLRGLAVELANREATLQQQIGSSSSELRQIPQRVIEGQRLARDVEIKDQMYRQTESRVQEARLAEVSAIPDVRPFDRAVQPHLPVADMAPFVVLGGLVGSFALAVLVAVLLDRMDSRVRYPDQVTQDLGLNILGAIPRVPGGRRGLRDADMDHVIEALRGIRLNLMHADQAQGPLMLTITSPGSGDGKSFVSSNLALAFADAGQRTLLIDADVRRGQLHRLFGVPRKPGLTEVLTGRESRDVVIQHTEFDNLSFIACGTRTHSAPELLGSTTMNQLLTAARSSYDVILIDSPPMGAGIDPFALGTLTGKLLLVLRTGITDREMAGAKLGVLNRLPIRVVGAVLNDVRSDGALGYYYGSYSYHLPGYEASDEDDFEFEGEDDVVKVIEGGGAVIGGVEADEDEEKEE